MKKWISIGLALVAALLLLLGPEKPKKQYFHNEGRIFGTYYNIRYEGSEDLHEQIKAQLQEVDFSLSMFNLESTISKINRNETEETDALFQIMYKEAVLVSEESGGAFDITIAPLVNAWGFGKSKRIVNEVSVLEDEKVKSQVDSIKAFVGYQKTALNAQYLTKSDPRITLDASAIAKGFACDIVANFLKAQGCKNLLVDIGGEVVLQGVNDSGKAWRVGISKPKLDASGLEKDLQEVIASQSLCMATSGNYLQYYNVGNERRSHTIDPRSGSPVSHSLLSATIVAESCMRADALATACMVLGEKDALEMIERSLDAACYLIVADGDSLRISQSSRWAEMTEEK